MQRVSSWSKFASSMTASGPSSPFRGPGRARQLCPGISDLDFLGDLNRIVDLDAKISNRAFDPMASEP
jgi:hypothetical protein